MHVLTLPGLGDCHWTMLKMRALRDRDYPGQPIEMSLWNGDGRRSS